MVDPTVPKDDVPNVELGLLNAGVLKKLKNSALNWNLQRSVMGIFLKGEASKVINPGP